MYIPDYSEDGFLQRIKKHTDFNKIAKGSLLAMVPELVKYIMEHLIDWGFEVTENTSLSHDWMYFPEGKSLLQFDLYQPILSNLFGSGRVEVAFEDASGQEIYIENVYNLDHVGLGEFKGKERITVDIPSVLRGNTGRFTVRVINEGSASPIPFIVHTSVTVDNFKLVGFSPLMANPADLPADEVNTAVGELSNAVLVEFKNIVLDIWARTSISENILSSLQDVGLVFADLEPGMLARTEFRADGSIIISVDRTAVGRGWFVDLTPLENEEFVPSLTDPLNLMGQGEAAGKFDLLTVLLHEYGHAFGLQDLSETQYPSHLMSEQLKAGERVLPGVLRMPDEETEEETATGNGDEEQNYDPARLPSGEPFEPPQAGVPQHDLEANAQFENTDFNSSDGWITTGEVEFNNGSATLKEVADSHTRLNQLFVVGEHDRYLSFRVDGLALSNEGIGPDDAFEVALLNALTGETILGGTGLTKSDAILNLQADGTEYAGAAVTVICNLDGSRTVLINLAGIAAGTILNLSFDLIGFGRGASAESSRVTIRDLHIGLPPDIRFEARDDEFRIPAGTTTVLDILANDEGARQKGVVPVLVEGPSRGTLVINADGTISYEPEEGWFGVTSFTYKLSNGFASSNEATVRLIVASENGTPVAGDGEYTLKEDMAQVIDFATLASDPDNDALTVEIVAGPTHGMLTLNGDGTYTYVPAEHWSGEDSFVYRVTDGEFYSDQATVRLIVTAVADRPILEVAESCSGWQDNWIDLPPITTSLVDTDGSERFMFLIQGLPVGTIITDGVNEFVSREGWSLLIHPRHDDVTELSWDVTSLRIKPPTGYQGEFELLLRAIAEEQGSTSQTNTQATLRVTVMEVPVAFPRDDMVEMNEDTSATFDPRVNDDTHGLDLEVVLWEDWGPKHGTLQTNEDGTLTYVPDEHWSGTDSFVYVLRGPNGDSRPATVWLVVKPIADKPILEVAESCSGWQNFWIDLPPITTSLVDTDGSERFMFVIQGLPVGTIITDGVNEFVSRQGWSLVIEAPQDNVTELPWDLTRLRIKTPDDYHGEFELQLRAIAHEQANNYQTNTQATLRVMVKAWPVLLETRDDSIETDEDTPITFDPKVNDEQLDAELSIVLLDNPGHGRAWVNDDGTVTYVPDEHWSGTDSFEYVLRGDGIDSVPATVWITVNPVADKPRLTFSYDKDELIDYGSDWKTGNTEDPREFLQQEAFDDWNLVTGSDAVAGGVDGFEIWHKVGYVRDDDGVCHVVENQPVGSDYLKLSDAGGSGWQTLGIERTIPTRVGATYTFNFKVLTLPGYVLNENCRLAVYVDGLENGELSLVSTILPGGQLGGPAMFWGDIYGSGEEVTVRIVMETLDGAPADGGLLIGSLYLYETYPYNRGREGVPISVHAIEAALTDTDGSETLSVSIHDIPAGFTLTDGENSFTASESNHWVDITGWNHATKGALNILVPYGAGLVGDYVLKVVATATEEANGDQAHTEANLIVKVASSAGTPIAADDSFTLEEDNAITMDLLANGLDTTGQGLEGILLWGRPKNGIVVINDDGTVTYTPNAHWSGTDSFSYEVYATVGGQRVDSNVATVTLTVEPVADSPILRVDHGHHAPQELFRTGWESVANPNKNYTLVQPASNELEGWKLVTTSEAERSQGGVNGFKIWSAGDYMTHPATAGRTIANAGLNNGKNWLELCDAFGTGAQTLGIERTVDTVEGALYTLSFDVAGWPGLGSHYTRIGIYVDDVRIGEDLTNSGLGMLGWVERSFQFVGTGEPMTIRILSEKSYVDIDFSRSMMIDDIVLTEALPAAVVGAPGETIQLPTLNVALTDRDGSEELILTIENIPVGSIVTDGTPGNKFTATQGNTTADITSWNLARLSFQPPADASGDIVLTVVATARETANGDEARTEKEIVVTVLGAQMSSFGFSAAGMGAPMAQTATTGAAQAVDASYAFYQNQSARIDFAGLVHAAEAEVSVTDPQNGTLKREDDGTYTYTPDAGFKGTDSFIYIVSHGGRTTLATVELVVKPGWILQSAPSPIRQATVHESFILLTNGGVQAMKLPVINWNSGLSSFAYSQDDEWLAALYQRDTATVQSLAESSGLRVKIE